METLSKSSMLQISSSAIKEIRRIQSHQKQSDSPLKLTINSGGCSGLFYDLKFEKDFKGKDFSDSSQYKSLSVNGISLIVEQDYSEYIKNLKIDYAEDLMGGGFRFHNPLAKKVCGCGISFKIAED